MNKILYPVLIEYTDKVGNPLYYFSESSTYTELRKECEKLSKKYQCNVNYTEFQAITEGVISYDE